jgi:hypothetical protein
MRKRFVADAAKNASATAEAQARPLHRSLKEWTSAITGAWQKTVSSILETGRLLIEAKDDLDHGQWEAIFETDQFPFGLSAAKKIMTVTRNSVLGNRDFSPGLPASWQTLYECTKLPEQQLRLAIQDGRINPATSKKTVVAMRPDIKRIESGDDEHDGDDAISETMLLEFFEQASGSDIFDRIPDARRNEVCRGFLDKLTVAGLLVSMSETFGRELRDRMPTRRKMTPEQMADYQKLKRTRVWSRKGLPS